MRLILLKGLEKIIPEGKTWCDVKKFLRFYKCENMFLLPMFGTKYTEKARRSQAAQE